MKKIIEWLEDHEDFIGFPLLIIDIALLWILAYGAGCT